MTKKEIIAKLTELKVEHDSNAKKADLEALLPAPSSDSEPSAPAVVRPDPVKFLANQYVFVKISGTATSQSTAERLASEPKTEIVIFPQAGEGNAQTYFCWINGVYFAIVMGVDVQLPVSVAEFVKKSRIANQRIEKNVIVTNPFTGEKINVDLSSNRDGRGPLLGTV